MIPVHEFREIAIKLSEKYSRKYLSNIVLYAEELTLGNLEQAKIFKTEADKYLEIAKDIEKSFTGATTATDFIENKVNSMRQKQPIHQVAILLQKQLNNEQ